MSTPNLGIPLYGSDDTAELDTLLNGQATAIDSSVQGAIEDAVDELEAKIQNRIDSGSVTIRGSGDVYADGTVTFNSNFSMPPQVIAGSELGGSSTNNLVQVAKAFNVTTTGCNIRLKTSQGTFSSSYSIPWIAVGPVES